MHPAAFLSPSSQILAPVEAELQARAEAALKLAQEAQQQVGSGRSGLGSSAGVGEKRGGQQVQLQVCAAGYILLTHTQCLRLKPVHLQVLQDTAPPARSSGH